MYVNDDCRALYIHIVKNGGNYVRDLLQKYYQFRQIDQRPHPQHGAFYRTEHDNTVDVDRYHHSITRAGKVRYYRSNPNYPNLGRKLEDYFTFTFVRNPYERLFSAFAYLKRTLYHKQKEEGKFVLHQTPENPDNYVDFETFVHRRDDITPVAYHHAFCSQYDQLVDENGTIGVSFIGHVETLDDDLIVCMAILGKELRHAEELTYGKRANVNHLDDQNLTHHYTPDILAWVNDHFAHDFEVFGYPKYNTWEAFCAHYVQERQKTGVKAAPSEQTVSSLFVPLPTFVPARNVPTVRCPIPLNIIQTYKTHLVHPAVYQNVQHIINMNLDCNYYLITDAAGESLIQEHFDARTLAAFRTLKNGSAKGDFIRYVALYVYGGLYLDMDAAMCQPLHTMLTPDTEYVLFYYHNIVMMTQWVILIQERHELMRRMVNEMVKRIENKEGSIIQATGPKLYSDVTYAYLNGEEVYHVQYVFTKEERIRYIVEHERVAETRGRILSDLHHRHWFLFNFPGYKNDMLYHDEFKYNETAYDIYDKVLHKSPPPPTLFRVPSLPSTSMSSTLYKELVLLAFGQDKQQEAVASYQRIINILLKEVRKVSLYTEIKSVEDIREQVNTANECVSTFANVGRKTLQGVTERAFDQLGQRHTRRSCPSCGYGCWNVLALEVHGKTCHIQT